MKRKSREGVVVDERGRLVIIFDLSSRRKCRDGNAFFVVDLNGTRLIKAAEC